MSSDVVRRATLFALYALVARSYGEFKFGQLSLALTYLYLFQVFSEAGLKFVLIREISRDKAKANDYLFHSSFAVILPTAASTFLLLIFVQIMGYNPETTNLILLISLGLLPRTLSSICESIFKAYEKMSLIAYANIPISVIKIAAAYLLIKWGYGVFHLGVLLVAMEFVLLFVEWILFHFRIHPLRFSWQFSASLAIIRKSTTFLAMNSILALYNSLSILLLSKIENEETVGLLAAITQLLLPITMVIRSVITSIFPIMCRKFKYENQNLASISQYLAGILLMLVMPMSFGIFYMGDSALVFIYGIENYLHGSLAIKIMAWVVITKALSNCLGQTLVASNKEKVNLRILTINLAISLPLSFVFIYNFGLLGAAAHALIISLINFVQHYYAVTKLGTKISFFNITWKPLVACLILSSFFSQGGQDLHIVLASLIGGLVYIGGLILLHLWPIGNIRTLKTDYYRIFST